MISAAPVLAATDCRIRALPPASYAQTPLPNVNYKGLALADLQQLYRQLAGLPKRAAGLDYCADPLGFVYPWRDPSAAPTIYYPTDVTDRCRREVLAHEEAHAKGWPMNHPGATLQVGPCAAARQAGAWPRTLQR